MCNVKCININHSYLEQAHLTLCLFALENEIEITIRVRVQASNHKPLCKKKSIFFFLFIYSTKLAGKEDKSNNEFHHQLRKWRRWVINKYTATHIVDNSFLGKAGEVSVLWCLLIDKGFWYRLKSSHERIFFPHDWLLRLERHSDMIRRFIGDNFVY